MIATGNRPCIIDLGGWLVSDRTRFFIDFAQTLFRTTRGQRFIVIDEVHNFAPQGKVLDPDENDRLLIRIADLIDELAASVPTLNVVELEKLAIVAALAKHAGGHGAVRAAQGGCCRNPENRLVYAIEPPASDVPGTPVHPNGRGRERPPPPPGAAGFT